MNYYDDPFGVALVIVIALVFIGLALALMLYLFESIGLMKIAKNLGQPNAGIAFIPIANLYLLGKIVFKEDWLTWSLIALNALSFSLAVLRSSSSALSAISTLVVLLAFALNAVAYYKLYDKLSDKAIIMLVFSILTFNLLAPIFIFAIRNNKLRENVE